MNKTILMGKTDKRSGGEISQDENNTAMANTRWQ